MPNPEKSSISSSSAADLSLWIDKVKKQHPRARLELHKVGYPDIVMSWDLAELEELEDLAQDVSELAEREGAHSATSTGRIAFRLRAVSESGTAHASTTFTVAGAPEGKGAEVPSDHAHMIGAAVQQLLKANNDLGALLIRSVQNRDEAWQAQNQLLLEQNLELRKEHFDVLKQWQKHVILETEQKRLTAQITREEKRDEELFEQFRTYLPIIANRLGGGGRGKGAPAAQELFDGVISKFTPEQMDALMSPASPLDKEQKMLLYELFTSFMKRKVTPLNAEDGAANGTANGS